MMNPADPIRPCLLAALALWSATMAGCALDRLPRIDPTGQRLLIFPDEPVPTAVAPVAGGVAPALPATPSNVVAPPVFSDPALPGTTTSTDLLGQPVVVGPPVATTTGAPVAAPAQSVERVIMTPERVLAPVGGEVVLRAGVCATSGYLLTNERIEWMLDRQGVGQIVTVGGRGELDIFRLPRNTPRKIDNYYVISASSPYPECLDRGTPDPSDDVQIRRGDAWITVSSATEGTSYVTAYAPGVENWSGRTASATIFWIDAQWAFPPSVTLAPGESHTLTTTITRQSDGTPIAGWIVRYTVAGGTAGLGYDAGQASEITTNAQGRASVEISPTDAQAGVTDIQVEIIRPEQAGVVASPRVTVGTGVTRITWAQGGITGAPLPPASPQPSLEPGPAAPPSDDFTPAPAPTPAPTPAPEGQPDLFVQIEQRSPGPFRVGDTVDFQVTVVNQGQGEARNVKIVDEFDAGLTTDIAAPGVQFIETDRPFSLASGESFALPITFRITQAGRLSHNVRVTADNATPVSERAFIAVEQAATQVEPSLQVTIAGPEQHTVGEMATFRVKVENVGASPATGVILTNSRDPQLEAKQASGFDETNQAQVDHFNQTGGEIRWDIGRLDPGQSVTYDVQCLCVAPARSACSRVEVTADGLRAAKLDQKCIEIRPQLDGGAGAPPPGAATGGGLDIEFTETKVPRVQDRFLIYVTLRNNTGQPQQNVQLRVLIPPQLRADFQQVQSRAATQTAPWGEHGTALIVGPIARLEAGASESITIPVDAVTQGNTKVIADAQSATLEPQAVEREIVVLAR